jgi:DNA modification methylase
MATTKIPTNEIVCGDAGTILQSFPDASVDTVITSPPYYKQRDYSTEIQIGNEDLPEEYISSLLLVFRECYRVLKDTGSFWLNIGDKYEKGRLLGMPWRVAFGLVENDWILRSDIIWHKPNAVPSSVKNRPTHDHEYLFFFTKIPNGYYYDQDAIREPHVTFTEKSRMMGGRGHFGQRGGTPENGKYGGSSNLHTGRWDQAFHPKGRNKRTVWSIPLSKFRDAHFAVFPGKLITPCILAGCPLGGIALDPFFGAGTTGIVALRHGRNFIGIDSNPDYCNMAKERLAEVQTELLL